MPQMPTPEEWAEATAALKKDDLAPMEALCVAMDKPPTLAAVFHAALNDIRNCEREIAADGIDGVAMLEEELRFVRRMAPQTLKVAKDAADRARELERLIHDATLRAANAAYARQRLMGLRAYFAELVDPEATSADKLPPASLTTYCDSYDMLSRPPFEIDPLFKSWRDISPLKDPKLR